MLKKGRNDACWCGSGKKYKNCHLAFDRKLIEITVLWAIWCRALHDQDPERRSQGISEGRRGECEDLDLVDSFIRPGISTEDINTWSMKIR